MKTKINKNQQTETFNDLPKIFQNSPSVQKMREESKQLLAKIPLESLAKVINA